MGTLNFNGLYNNKKDVSTQKELAEDNFRSTLRTFNTHTGQTALKESCFIADRLFVPYVV
jgi:hypothetical protein